jgi:hypothetical protein
VNFGFYWFPHAIKDTVSITMHFSHCNTIWLHSGIQWSHQAWPFISVCDILFFIINALLLLHKSVFFILVP